MDGLTVGRVVHVIEPYNLYCQAGIVSGIEDAEKGHISVHVFVPTLDEKRQVELRMGIVYS